MGDRELSDDDEGATTEFALGDRTSRLPATVSDDPRRHLPGLEHELALVEQQPVEIRWVRLDRADLGREHPRFPKAAGARASRSRIATGCGASTPS